MWKLISLMMDDILLDLENFGKFLDFSIILRCEFRLMNLMPVNFPGSFSPEKTFPKKGPVNKFLCQYHVRVLSFFLGRYVLTLA